MGIPGELPQYSQCGEDHLLAVLLGELGHFCAPSIAEIGAGDPYEYSNSRYVIEQGWQALLVEANPELVQRLAATYEGNQSVTVRQAVVAPEEGSALFHVSRLHWALSGIGGVSYPDQHGPDDVDVVDVRTCRASDVLADWLPGVEQLGVLCIDLEGMDLEVLQEVLDDRDLRPDVILIEALDRAEFDQQWRFLQGQGYAFIRNLWLSNAWVRADLPRAGDVVRIGRAATIPAASPH